MLKWFPCWGHLSLPGAICDPILVVGWTCFPWWVLYFTFPLKQVIQDYPNSLWISNHSVSWGSYPHVWSPSFFKSIVPPAIITRSQLGAFKLQQLCKGHSWLDNLDRNPSWKPNNNYLGYCFSLCKCKWIEMDEHWPFLSFMSDLFGGKPSVPLSATALWTFR